MDPPPVQVIVEGQVDESVAKRLLEDAGITVSRFHHRSIPSFRKALREYNQAARYSFWFALCDLDRAACPPLRLADFLPSPRKRMCFRIAVRSVESWLLADRSAMARFLGVRVALLPEDPEAAPDPKSTIVSLAKHSGNAEVRAGIRPARGTATRTGPTYAGKMSEFAETAWPPGRAAASAPSLKRTLERCGNLVRTGAW